MSIIYSSPGPRCCWVVWASATIAAAWLRHRTDYCAFLLKRCEPHGVLSPCGHSCMVCAIVCLTVMPPFSDTTDVSTIDHSFTMDRSRTFFFHIAQCKDDIIGRELNLRKLPDQEWEPIPQPSEQLRPMRIKTSASTEMATVEWGRADWHCAMLNCLLIERIWQQTRHTRVCVCVSMCVYAMHVLFYSWLFLSVSSLESKLGICPPDKWIVHCRRSQRVPWCYGSKRLT